MLGEQALTTFARYCQHDAIASEAGGVLLGRFIQGTSDIVVDDVTMPGEGDTASRFAFRRGRRRTQQLIDQAWHDSGGTRNYLGEWHTHPEDDPTPSPTDRKNWQRIAAMAHYEQESLFFVIVGRKYTRIWEASKSSGTLFRLDDTENES